MGRKRAPLVTVSSDDFVIKDGDEEYHPHEGEVVTFKRKISSRDLLVVAQATNLPGESSADKMARFFHDDACPVLKRAIFSWTWTDMFTGEPLGKELGKDGDERVPSLDDLRDLDAMTEIRYLLDAWMDVTNETVQEKNQQQPSS